MRIVVDGVELQLEPTEWEVVYPVHVEPIGRIRRRRDGFHAKLEAELLGVYTTGDAAVEAIWHRFLEQSTARHEHAAITHGGQGRHAHS